MDVPNRGALMFVRFIGGCVMAIGLLDTGLYLTKCFEPKHPMPVKIFPMVVNSIPLVISVVILIKSRAIAEWLSEKLDI